MSALPPDRLDGEALGGSPPPSSLYLHFPFCRRRCHYCDFSVALRPEIPVEDWLDAVEGDLADWFELAAWPKPLVLETIFLGGGTPSLLGADGMRLLRRVLLRWFEWAEGSLEWTAEANPESLSAALLREWREVGVNRLSVGVQSFDDRVLAWLGRLHTAEQAADVVRDARRAGFDSLNIDLMFGLPTDVPRAWPREVEAAVGLHVTHVSAYGLTVEPRTPLGRRVAAGQVWPADEARYASEYREVASRLAAAGFDHYEVSNFAAPGYECRHNWQYWNGGAYLGLGPSAHSFLPPYRIWNVFGWDAYREGVRAGDAPRAGAERLEGPARELERIWLGLRTRAGLPAADAAWRDRPAGQEDRRLERWLEAGWVSRRGDRVRATVEGWLRLDELTAACAARE